MLTSKNNTVELTNPACLTVHQHVPTLSVTGNPFLCVEFLFIKTGDIQESQRISDKKKKRFMRNQNNTMDCVLIWEVAFSMNHRWTSLKLLLNRICV